MWHKIYSEAYLNEHFGHFQMGMYVNFPKVNAMLDKQSVLPMTVSICEWGAVLGGAAITLHVDIYSKRNTDR